MGIFSKIKQSLGKTRDKLKEAFSNLFSFDRIGEDFYDELTEILISADVSVKTSMDIVERLKEKMIKEKVKDKKVVIDNLKSILLDVLNDAGETLIDYPLVIMVVGVNGVGKTTSIGKMAKYFTSLGKSVTLCAGDTFRAAASEQLSVWADRAKVRIIKHAEGADPSSVVYDAVMSAKSKNTDVLIVDTAGRLHVKTNLMEELKKSARVIEREYSDATFIKLIVLDATTGQNAVNQVDSFDDAVLLDGIVLTKLDGTAKGGFIFSLSNEKQLPVTFVGVGEKIDDLELFDAKQFVDALFD